MLVTKAVLFNVLPVSLKSGLEKPILPITFSVPKLTLAFVLIPLPKKFFSLIEKLIEASELLTPAPALISPVAFSSTLIVILEF